MVGDGVHLLELRHMSATKAAGLALGLCNAAVFAFQSLGATIRSILFVFFQNHLGLDLGDILTHALHEFLCLIAELRLLAGKFELESRSAILAQGGGLGFAGGIGGHGFSHHVSIGILLDRVETQDETRVRLLRGTLVNLARMHLVMGWTGYGASWGLCSDRFLRTRGDGSSDTGWLGWSLDGFGGCSGGCVTLDIAAFVAFHHSRKLLSLLAPVLVCGALAVIFVGVVIECLGLRLRLLQ